MLSSLDIIPSQQEIYEEAMAKSFRMMVHSNKAFMQFGEGHIVLLFGSSTAGKSSLCREFRNISPNWFYDSNDKSSKRLLAQTLMDIELFKVSFPSRYMFLRSYFDDNQISIALTQGIDALLLEEGQLSLENKQKINMILNDISLIEELCSSMSNILIAQEEMFETAIRQSKQGVNVILDTLDFEYFMRFKEKRDFHCPFQAIFVFCPLKTLDKRVEGRHKRAVEQNNPDDFRPGMFPFLTYSAFVQRAKASDPVIDSVSSSQFIHILEKHTQQEEKFLPAGAVSGNLRALTDQIFSELKLDGNSSDIVDLTERYPSHYMLRTDENSPLELASTIKKRNKRRA